MSVEADMSSRQFSEFNSCFLYDLFTYRTAFILKKVFKNIMDIYLDMMTFYGVFSFQLTDFIKVFRS